MLPTYSCVYYNSIGNFLVDFKSKLQLSPDCNDLALIKSEFFILLAGCKVISVYSFTDLCCNTTTYEQQLPIQ